jgi:uncharacterized protein YjlB
MALREDAKKLIERLAGLGRPTKKVHNCAPLVTRPHTYRFKDNGETPNNPDLPLLIYRSAVRFSPKLNPAAVFEDLFASHGWKNSWRDSIYPYNHFHTGAHVELRAFVSGAERAADRSEGGRRHAFPAGVGHRRIAKSRDLLVVGAYPRAGKYDESKPS